MIEAGVNQDAQMKEWAGNPVEQLDRLERKEGSPDGKNKGYKLLFQLDESIKTKASPIRGRD